MTITPISKRVYHGGVSAVCAITAMYAAIAAGAEARDRNVVLSTSLAAPLGQPSTCQSRPGLPEVSVRTQDTTAACIESLTGNDAVVEVIVGQGRLLTLEKKVELANEGSVGVIAVGDPTVVDFEVLPNPRCIRLLGRRAGVTDLSITTADRQHVLCFEVRVVYDLTLLQVQLKQLFPDAHLRLFQIRQHLAVEGQARSVRQVDQILQTIEAYLASVQVPSSVRGDGAPNYRKPFEAGDQVRPRAPAQVSAADAEAALSGDAASPAAGAPRRPEGPDPLASESGSRPEVQATFAAPRIINLMRVPGAQQVMLKVQIAELNRTGLRQIGADFKWEFGTGNILQTLIGGENTTVTGVFPSADWEFVLRVLRQNLLLSVLAEPNLVALSGQKADFLAGGEFPVPVPQNSGGGTTITVEFKKFGVQLEFVPFVLEDETIRLTVSPEESSPDYTNAAQINGYLIPGINTRRASTTVEMRQGQTLAIAGLLRVSLDANTRRIPGLGDLPYIGILFSNTSHKRMEKELLVLVTPYLVAPINADDAPCLPGEEIKDPNDLEFYLLNRIEGRTGRDSPSTRNWDDPWQLRRLIRLERRCVSGPVGFSHGE